MKSAECDLYLQCDLEKFPQNKELQSAFQLSVFDFMASYSAQLKVLINNAAYQVVKELDTLSVEEFNKSLQVNLVAPFSMIRLFSESLRVSEGCVVNIGSIHSKLTKSAFSAYASSKAGLTAMTRSLAIELGGAVRLNTIVPAATRTRMLTEGFLGQEEKLVELGRYHPVGRIAEPYEIADLALFLSSERASFISGAEIPIDGAIGGQLYDPA